MILADNTQARLPSPVACYSAADHAVWSGARTVLAGKTPPCAARRGHAHKEGRRRAVRAAEAPRCPAGRLPALRDGATRVRGPGSPRWACGGREGIERC